MLLPLIERAIAADFEASRQRTLRRAAEVAGTRLRLTLRGSSAAFDLERDQESHADIRERLRAIYGKNASLVLRRIGSDVTEASLELPFEWLRVNVEAHNGANPPHDRDRSGAAERDAPSAA